MKLTLVSALLLGIMFAAGCEELPPGPLPSGSPSDVSLTRGDCVLDQAAGAATLAVELTSQSDYSLIQLSGDLTDVATGDVIGQGSGTLQDVKSGTTYRTQVVYSLDATSEGNVDCGVTISSAVPAPTSS